MRRGDVVRVADRSGQFTGKPRPAVIVQGDSFSEIASVSLCPITTVEVDAPLLRIRLEPTPSLALQFVSWVAVDKITTVRRRQVGNDPIGRMTDTDLLRLNSALALFLGFG